MPKIDAKIRRAFHERLAAWYRNNQRPLPWRENSGAYAVAISEFMCQQTQIATVLPYYARWMKSFPDWRELAAASEDKVLKHWEGLGYYNRVRNLHKLAKTVVRDFNGVLPSELETLRSLPGIGPYTAGAIASISFNQRAAVLDGNVERVLSRVFNLPWNVTRPAVKKLLWQLCESLMPDNHYGAHNQALMELGALVCSPHSPQCLLCPLNAVCRVSDPESRPVKTRTSITREKQEVAVLVTGKKIWLLDPSMPGRWKGFYRLPLFDESIMEKKVHIGRVAYSITRFRVEADAWTAKWKKRVSLKGRWVSGKALDQISLPAPHRKIIGLWLKSVTGARK